MAKQTCEDGSFRIEITLQFFIHGAKYFEVYFSHSEKILNIYTLRDYRNIPYSSTFRSHGDLLDVNVGVRPFCLQTALEG